MRRHQLIESKWSVTTKSGDSDFIWTVVPDSVPSERPYEEFSSDGVRNMISTGGK